MKKILVTFGDSKYKESLKELSQTAYEIGKVDSVFIYDDIWLIETPFYNQNKAILNLPRGKGYWLWKPLIILNVMQHNPDSVILYSDAALKVINNLDILFNLANDHQRLIFKLAPDGVPSHKAKEWIKGDCFSLMHCNESKYWEADMSNGAISVWKNTKDNQNYIKEWIKWGINPHIITDLPSVFSPNLFGFKDHRHDQAILSNMRVKYNWDFFRDPTQFGNMEKNIFTNSPYEQLFNHHRQKK